jgi:pimeloyl-ACP methyl ester carboxylesterase
MAGMAQQIISAIPARLTWIGLSLGELMTDLARSVEAMGQLHQQTARSGPPHSHADLPLARVPTLVRLGGQDPVTPLADHQAMAACVTGAERQVIESGGHLSTIEPPHAVRPAWTWWPRATD